MLAKDIVALCAAYPDLPVFAMVANEFADDYSTTFHGVDRAEHAFICEHNDRIYDDEDELAEVFASEDYDTRCDELGANVAPWTDEDDDRCHAAASRALDVECIMLYTSAATFTEAGLREVTER